MEIEEIENEYGSKENVNGERRNTNNPIANLDELRPEDGNLNSTIPQSKEAIDTSLLLWDVRPTQTSTEDTYSLIVYPNTIYDDKYGGPINFHIPPHTNGSLYDVEIHSEWCVKKGSKDLAEEEQVSIINNISNAMWSFVDVQVGDRVNIML